MATADPVSQRTPAAGPALAEFTSRISAELASTNPELPSFPEVAQRVRETLSREDVGVDQVVRVVGAEPSLSVRLLQLANSAALNPNAQRVHTLRSAISRIGFNMARSATMAFAMSQMRRAEAWRGLEARFHEIWEGNARLAAMSYCVARRCGRSDADQAMMAGMLNAMGRLFLLTRLSPFPALRNDPAMYAEIENVWQARAGRALLARWDLGDEVLRAACAYELAPQTKGGSATLSDVLYAAKLLLVQDRGGMMGPAFLATAPFLRLDLNAEGALAVLRASAAEFETLRAALAD